MKLLKGSASHDTQTPSALLDFMLRDWKPRSGKPPRPLKNAAVFAARRRAISRMFPGELLIIPTGHEKVRANDTHFRFRPSSDFYYLTGNLEPDCVLILDPQASGGHQDLLFVEPNSRGDSTFFTDRSRGELWVGPRMGVSASEAYFGVNRCHSLRELGKFLDEKRGHVRLLRSYSPDIDSRYPSTERDAEFATALSEMRLIKEKLEISELQAAVDSTQRGFEDVIRTLKKAISERQVEGVFNLRARVEGNDVGYGTIAASGSHACVLHWTRNDGEVRRGDLMLLDAGVEGNSLYTADVTRTLPISGKFTPDQRRLYDLVYQAQREALRAVKPGNDFMEPNRVAMRVLTEGLCELGILKVSAEEALREDRQLYRRYTLHNVSHMLGIDVHDCAKARQESYNFGKLQPGMVLTVEPGLYFQPDDLTVPARYRGIGLRIEDDVVVTARGHKNLSEKIPTSSTEVEKWMARVWKSKQGGL